MDTVESVDGTPIAFWRSGSGPPLVLVHGATADHSTTWRFVLPQLERRFTLYAMDRRGRGGSSDAPSYALQREAEDVAAVVDSIGEPAFRDLRVPTLLLVGGDSPQHEWDNARGVAAALPDARVESLPGQQHAAMYAAPELFVERVVAFLEG